MVEHNKDVTLMPLSASDVPAPRASNSSLSDLHGVYRDALFREHIPASFTESLVLNDAARRAAQLEYIDQAVAELEAQAVAGLSAVGLTAVGKVEAAPTAHLATIIASEGFQRLSLLSLNNSRALHRALVQSSDLQRERRLLSSMYGEIDPRFATEGQCLTYLMRRFRSGEQPCRRCGHAGSGCWIAARRCWECNQCKTQSGVRTSTVMERSPLPLMKWFSAVRILLIQPTIGTAALGAMISVTREPTVRQMARKIRAAMKDGDSSRLAGLDRVFIPGT